MFDQILNFARDVVVIGYMFVLRIGVPIIVTMFIGWWLERKLAEKDARLAAEWKQRKADKQAELANQQAPFHT